MKHAKYITYPSSSDTGNNNPDDQVIAAANNYTRFVERLLFLIENQYLIIPNGGSGDCMFKAVCQAVHRGEEQKHTEVRQRVVDFIVQERWEKFKESIEVQHISGNRSLAKKWKVNPVKTYHHYMSSTGTLGSSSELTAAGELFKYNFATIQEYAVESGKKIYRVENCYHFDDLDVPFHHFFFTGDFDNGHWEFLEPVGNPSKNQSLSDGVYEGLVTVMIDGNQSTVNNWLKIHTENTNDAYNLKFSSVRMPSKAISYPFEWDDFNYDQNGFVSLQGDTYEIVNSKHTDLFSVLGITFFQDLTEDQINKLEEEVLDYRYSNFSNINHKIITQPHSHGFSLTNFKYVSYPFKGNIQDLLAAADMFGFSFQIFIKSTEDGGVNMCKFIHIDRWGEEQERFERFFMRVYQPSEEHEAAFSKWWLLKPADKIERPISQECEATEDENRNIGDCYSQDEDEIEATPERPIKVKHAEMPIKNSEFTSNTRQSSKNRTSDVGFKTYRQQRKSKSSRTSRSVSRSDNDQVVEITAEIEEEISSKRSQEIDSQDIKKTTNSFNKIHDKFSRSIIPNSSQEIEKLSQIEIETGSEDEIELPITHERKSGSQKIKTVVEMFDEKSKKRKKYVYHGFVTREKVLEGLYNQGLIRKPASNHQIRKKGDLLSRKSTKDDLSIRKKDELVVRFSGSSINPTTSKVSVFDMTEENANQNFQNEPELDCGTNKEPFDLEYGLKRSVSNIALADKDSLLHRFFKIHRRVAPSNRENEDDQRGCFKRFFSWAVLKIRSFK